MKKHLTCLLGLLCLLCLLCVSVNAEQSPELIEQVLFMDIIQNGGFPEFPDASICSDTRIFEPARSADDTLADVKTALKQGLQALQDEIDISKYQISSIDAIKDIYTQLINENPELFFAANQFGFAGNGTGKIAAFYPYYQINGAVYKTLTEEQKIQLRQQQAVLEQLVSGIIEQVDPTWSELEKALFLHDYLATHAQYDNTLQIRDAYSILVEGTGVCQAYTLAYRLLLNRVFITSGTVSSRTLNHIWNILLIGDSWYHVDVTWDDPTKDRIGLSQHTYFCLSEEKLKITNNGGHNAPDLKYSLDVKADDKTFDNYYWANVDSAFVPLNGAWYYLDVQNGLMRTTAPEKPGTQEKRINAKWYVWGSSYSSWNGIFSGLSCYNGELIYNTPDAVYRYDPNTKTAQSVLSLTSAERAEGYICGTVVVGNELWYSVQQSPYAEEPAEPRIHKLDRYTAVTAGGYAYYLDGKTLHLKRDGTQSGSVIAAWYSEEDKLLGILILNEWELTADVSDAKTVKIFAAANTDYHPLCEATVCTLG